MARHQCLENPLSGYTGQVVQTSSENFGSLDEVLDLQHVRERVLEGGEDALFLGDPDELEAPSVQLQRPWLLRDPVCNKPRGFVSRVKVPYSPVYESHPSRGRTPAFALIFWCQFTLK